MPAPKPIRLSANAVEQCIERGATREEVEKAVREGERERAKRGRRYAMKQVAPVVAESPDELVVVTVYTFYF